MEWLSNYKVQKVIFHEICSNKLPENVITLAA